MFYSQLFDITNNVTVNNLVHKIYLSDSVFLIWFPRDEFIAALMLIYVFIMTVLQIMFLFLSFSGFYHDAPWCVYPTYVYPA